VALLTKEQLIEKYGTLAEAARRMGISRSTLADRCKKGPVEDAPENSSRAGRSLSEFRNTFDKSTIVPAKIREALAKLGPDNWEYEVQFAKLAGVSLTDLATFREMFADYIVHIRRDSKRAWAGSPATAKIMRQMID
jgi:hypothetical protein